MEMNFTIYQLADARLTDYGFMGWSYALKHGFKLDDYEEIYSGAVRCKNVNDALEELYVTFNMNHPSDYRGRSLSVSDVVGLEYKGNTRYYYCDSFGWQDVTTYVATQEAFS